MHVFNCYAFAAMCYSAVNMEMADHLTFLGGGVCGGGGGGGSPVTNMLKKNELFI